MQLCRLSMQRKNQTLYCICINFLGDSVCVCVYGNELFIMEILFGTQHQRVLCVVILIKVNVYMQPVWLLKKKNLIREYSVIAYIAILYAFARSEVKIFACISWTKKIISNIKLLKCRTSRAMFLYKILKFFNLSRIVNI